MIVSLKRIFATLTLILIASATAVLALDLPVKTVNGRQYYYYRVDSRESVHGLSKKLGLSREQIVEYNPSVADGVKRGTILYFPVDDFSENDIIDNEDADNLPVQIEADTGSASTDTAVCNSTVKIPQAIIALPFGLDSGNETRQNKHALDFYKGFLIAADTLAGRYGKVDVQTVDYTGGQTLPDSTLSKSVVAVVPEDENALISIGSTCEQHETYVLNLFNVRDTTYLSNPYMIQANIPAGLMYRKAADGLLENYPGFTPVIIRNTTGRNEKEPFTDYLVQLCDSLGKEYIRIDYSGSLTSSDLAVLDNGTAKDYVIVPSSGTLAEFNKFIYVLRNFRDSHILRDDSTDNISEDTAMQQIALFGYPDWIAFRGDAEELLHVMQATIYSRFYDDYDNFTSRNIEADFLRWYGVPMIESVPSQGLLGFDAGCYIIKNIRANDGKFRPDYPASYQGVQSTFRFERVPGGGFVNSALYIVQYLPAGRMSARVL